MEAFGKARGVYYQWFWLPTTLWLATQLVSIALVSANAFWGEGLAAIWGWGLVMLSFAFGLWGMVLIIWGSAIRARVIGLCMATAFAASNVMVFVAILLYMRIAN
jgi:hypothetical protein